MLLVSDGGGLVVALSRRRSQVARIAGGASVVVSVALFLIVVLRPNVELGVLSLWTIVLGAVGGSIPFWRGTRSAAATAGGVIFVASIPALVAAVGALYWPSVVVLLVIGAQRDAA